jgi:protein piccolo
MNPKLKARLTQRQRSNTEELEDVIDSLMDDKPSSIKTKSPHEIDYSYSPSTPKFDDIISSILAEDEDLTFPKQKQSSPVNSKTISPANTDVIAENKKVKLDTSSDGDDRDEMKYTVASNISLRDKLKEARTGVSKRDPNIKFDGKLLVHLIRGVCLKVADMNGKSDPYCLIAVGKGLMGQDLYSGHIARSNTIYVTVDPEWDEKITLHVSDVEQNILHCEVWDYDQYKSDDFLGDAHLQLSDYNLLSGNPASLNIKLDNVDTGVIELDLTYVPFSQ